MLDQQFIKSGPEYNDSIVMLFIFTLCHLSERHSTFVTSRIGQSGAMNDNKGIKSSEKKNPYILGLDCKNPYILGLDRKDIHPVGRMYEKAK